MPAGYLRQPGVSQAVRRRRRSVAAALLVAVVLGLLIALQATFGGGTGGPLTADATSRSVPAGGAGQSVVARAVVARAWVVRPGDTLWSIAEAVHPHGDVRGLVDQLSREVHGRPLTVGQRVPLP